jgi:hypothetical protein
LDADPIFSAIGAARRSLAMLRALGDGAVADKEFDAASIAYDNLVRELLRTQPTTLAGLLATSATSATARTRAITCSPSSWTRKRAPPT